MLPFSMELDCLLLTMRSQLQLAFWDEFRTASRVDRLHLPPHRVVLTPSSSKLPYPQSTIPQGADQETPTYIQGTPNPSQASFITPTLSSPFYGSEKEINSYQSLIQTMPSHSILSRIFSSTPRPYYQINPLPLKPAVVPSYECTEDSEDILEEGREAVDRLWDAADSALDRLRPHSAPLLQAPWSSFMEDEFYIEREETETQCRPPYESGKRIQSESVLTFSKPTTRSEPVLTFSKPAPRFKRNVSGPPRTG